MILMFLVHLVSREINRPKTIPKREPPNATTKKDTGVKHRQIISFQREIT